MQPGSMKNGPARTAVVFLITLALLLPWSMAALAAEMTPQMEKDFGERVHLKLAAVGVLLHDPISNAYFGKVADRVLRGAGLKPGQYKFYIVKNDDIKVLTVPGGYIYMYTGTISSLENEGQLASLLAHELGHLTSRHFARRVEAASSLYMFYLSFMLESMVAPPPLYNCLSCCVYSPPINPNGPESAIRQLLTNSRDEEDEADAKGRQYLTEAGYNPHDMYAAFKIMSQQTDQVSSEVPTYISTHPALTNRLATTLKDEESLPHSPPDATYQAFRDRVLVLTGGPRRIQIIMGKRLNAEKNDHSALHTLGLLAARQQNLTNADKLMKQALILDSGNREYLADLGDLALRRRKPDEAKVYYEQAGPDNPQVVLGLARASEFLGEKERAAALYDQALAMTPESAPEALELTAHFFDQNGQKYKGYYYLGRYYTSVGQVDKAIFNYEEAARQPKAGKFRTMANREVDYLKKITKGDQK